MTTRLASVTTTKAVELLAQLIRKQLLPVPSPDRYGEAAIGAAGAPTLDAANSVGIASIAHGANPGRYTVTLSEPTARILGLAISWSGIGDGGTTGVPYAPIVGIIERTTNTIEFQISPVDSGPGDVPFWQDPYDGEVMLFRVFCKD